MEMPGKRLQKKSAKESNATLTGFEANFEIARIRLICRGLRRKNHQRPKMIESQDRADLRGFCVRNCLKLYLVRIDADNISRES